jgi:hypothetical protein
MLKGRVDTFGVVINFLNEYWNPMHVTMGLYEMNETSGQNMVIQLQSLFSKLGLMCCDYILKNKGINLTTMASTLCSIIDYEQVINL